MDEYYMTKALALAKLGEGKVNPNPMVGAVIVKDSKIIGEGYHGTYGQAHAEVNAFKNCSESAEGATLYVTLEPCSHYGKTPPCVDLVIKEKVNRVVIGTLDPNPLVAGRGIRKLKEAGVEVTVGVLEKECQHLNAVFMKYIVTQVPYVVMKTAMSLDGKIATATGQSKWITGEEARYDVHKLRNKLMGIMIGSQTAILDNPFLTCRIEDGRNPIPIVVDSCLQIDPHSHLVQGAKVNRLIIATTKKVPEEKKQVLKAAGATIIETEAKENHVDLKALMKILGEMGIDSVLLEGGATLNEAALKAGIIDQVKCYISPKIIGGEKAKTPVEGRGIDQLEEAIALENVEVSKVGEDLCITATVKKGEA